MKILYNAWATNYSELQSDESTLYRLDLYNKTRYSRRKDLSGVLEIASRRFHDERKVYFVTILQDEVPFAFMEINNDFVHVGFLDTCKRECVQFIFFERTPGRLFLTQLKYWEFVGSTDKMLHFSDSTFSMDGDLRVDDHDFVTNQTRVRTSVDKLDVSDLWEDYPEFGQYDKLIQLGRVNRVLGKGK